MAKTSRTHEAIDNAIESGQESGFRKHLGASVIGRECPREVWYIFRWAARVKHPAARLRLFNRGNMEEDRFAWWLRSAGVHVFQTDPETGRQYRISDHGGHFGGSLDALLFSVPDIPGEWVVGEFKTHNDKSFKELIKSGVAGAKWEHYVQMQIYMHKTGLRYALYFAIDKNDDELYTEVVQYNDAIAREYIARAGKLIVMEQPPTRISESPSWYKCKMCDFLQVCHYGVPMLKNCRTCVSALPVDGGKWVCRAHDNYELTYEMQLQGCSDHIPIRGS